MLMLANFYQDMQKKLNPVQYKQRKQKEISIFLLSSRSLTFLFITKQAGKTPPY